MLASGIKHCNDKDVVWHFTAPTQHNLCPAKDFITDPDEHLYNKPLTDHSLHLKNPYTEIVIPKESLLSGGGRSIQLLLFLRPGSPEHSAMQSCKRSHAHVSGTELMQHYIFPVMVRCAKGLQTHLS